MVIGISLLFLLLHLYDYSTNDPCNKLTEGGKSWRLPTQDEFERLANYDCNPSTAVTSTRITDMTVAGKAGKAYTWVPVECSNVTHQCVPSINWTTYNYLSNTGANSGCAIYKTSDLSDVTLDGTVDLLSLGIDSVLFLPAVGMRELATGSVDYVGRSGYYWGSGVSSSNAHALALDSKLVRPDHVNARANAVSVRCVAVNP